MALDNPDWTKAASSGGAATSGTIPAGTLGTAIPVGGAEAFFVSLAGSTFNFISGQINVPTWNSLDALKVFPTPAVYQVAGLHWGSGFFLVPCAGYTFLRIDNFASASPCVFVATAIYGTPMLSLLGPQLMASSYPVTLASDQLPLAATLGPSPPSALLSATNDATVAAAGVSQIIAAVGGKAITVYGVQYSLEAAAAGLQSWAIQDAHNKAVAKGRVNTVIPIADSFWIPGGFALTVGDACNFVVGGGAPGIDYGARLFYTQ